MSERCTRNRERVIGVEELAVDNEVFSATVNPAFTT